MNDNTFAAVLYSIVLVFVGGLVLAKCLGGCDDIDETRRALDAAGVQNVEIGGHSLMGCGRDDFSAVEFTGMNQQGRPVDGVVCCGIFKGCTVRW